MSSEIIDVTRTHLRRGMLVYDQARGEHDLFRTRSDCVANREGRDTCLIADSRLCHIAQAFPITIIMNAKMKIQRILTQFEVCHARVCPKPNLLTSLADSKRGC